MDELVDSMANSAAVSEDVLNTNLQHPRYSQYKMKRDKWSQDERRNKLLAIQKQNRFDYLSLVRNLSDNNWVNDMADQEEKVEEADSEQMDTDVRLNKPGRHYKDQLMLSEWLVEVPQDFSSEWVLVPCPVGKRNLVVAVQGRTKAYAKSGYCIETFSSHLPGGGRHLEKRGKDCTLLDCVFDEAAKTFYILDVMGWVNQVFYDSETEFRFFWLQTKVADVVELETISNNNKYRFVNLPKFSCTQQGMLDALSCPVASKLDGLLFYHKRTHYTFGSTPLVVWLKAYMVPDTLGWVVPETYLQNKPSSYVNYTSHLDQVARDKAQTDVSGNEGKHSSRKTSDRHKQRMDCDGASDINASNSNGFGTVNSSTEVTMNDATR